MSYGLTDIRGEEKYGALETAQNCSGGDELVRAADLALVLLARQAHYEGWIDYSDDLADSMRRQHVWACRIEQPEPCPRKAQNLAGGCTDWAGVTLWVARYGPPLCAAADPVGVRNCVATPEEQSEVWETTLLHELLNVIVLRSGIYDPTYSAAIYRSGLEQRARATYDAARAAERATGAP